MATAKVTRSGPPGMARGGPAPPTPPADEILVVRARRGLLLAGELEPVWRPDSLVAPE